MKLIATRIFRVRGHVQGVGFRYATQQKAQELSLHGWVRNCQDRTVEARATGSNESLNTLERWLHHGPPGAKVDQVESSVLDDNDAAEQVTQSAGFEILR